MRLRGLLQLRRQPSDELVLCGLIGPRPAGRRHHARAEFANDLLPNLWLRRDLVDIDVCQRQIPRPSALIVTAHAVAVEERALRGDWCRVTRWCRRTSRG